MIDIPGDMQGEIMPLKLEIITKWDGEMLYYTYYEYPSVHMVKRHYGIVRKDYKLMISTMI